MDWYKWNVIMPLWNDPLWYMCSECITVGCRIEIGILELKAFHSLHSVRKWPFCIKKLTRAPAQPVRAVFFFLSTHHGPTLGLYSIFFSKMFTLHHFNIDFSLYFYMPTSNGPMWHAQWGTIMTFGENWKWSYPKILSSLFLVCSLVSKMVWTRSYNQKLSDSWV